MTADGDVGVLQTADGTNGALLVHPKHNFMCIAVAPDVERRAIRAGIRPGHLKPCAHVTEVVRADAVIFRAMWIRFDSAAGAMVTGNSPIGTAIRPDALPASVVAPDVVTDGVTAIGPRGPFITVIPDRRLDRQGQCQ